MKMKNFPILRMQTIIRGVRPIIQTITVPDSQVLFILPTKHGDQYRMGILFGQAKFETYKVTVRIESNYEYFNKYPGRFCAWIDPAEDSDAEIEKIIRRLYRLQQEQFVPSKTDE